MTDVRRGASRTTAREPDDGDRRGAAPVASGESSGASSARARLARRGRRHLLIVLYAARAVRAVRRAVRRRMRWTASASSTRPRALHWIDAGGGFHLWPFVHPTRLDRRRRFVYAEDRAVACCRCDCSCAGARYRLFGVVPDRSTSLRGRCARARSTCSATDAPGRDVLSRLLFGAQVSLTVGLVGIAISFTPRAAAGRHLRATSAAGSTTLIMRATELLLSIPGLYLHDRAARRLPDRPRRASRSTSGSWSSWRSSAGPASRA